MSSFSVKDLTCPVCHDIFKHPVILSCSHSLCKACLQEWWRKKPQQCPVCGSKDPSCRPICNLALKNLCESIALETVQRISPGWENVCSLHSDQFKLFCLDHQQPVCLVCRDSKVHANHKFRHIDEAAQNHREELRKSLKIIKWTLKLFNQVKEPCNQTAEHIAVQVLHREIQTHTEFMSLPQFLLEQEEPGVTAPMEEEEHKGRMIKTVGLSKAKEALSSRITAIEEELEADDVSILKNYKNTMELLQCPLPLPYDPELVSGAKYDQKPGQS